MKIPPTMIEPVFENIGRKVDHPEGPIFGREYVLLSPHIWSLMSKTRRYHVTGSCHFLSNSFPDIVGYVVVFLPFIQTFVLALPESD